MTPDKYTEQLRIVLQQYRKKMGDIMELYWAIERIKEKSKPNIYKEINIREAGNRISELTQ